tara:strand:+ start:1765 stop:2145 length:381 start_codon:yes stop_codon:yes gene_type:complete
MPKQWIPEIFYEDMEDGLTSHIPFISVPSGEEMPKLLYIFESRETGDMEPGPDGEDLPVTEVTLHQFADMEKLKLGLTSYEYDRVRITLGLEPLESAVEKGRNITSAVREKLGIVEGKFPEPGEQE